MQLYKTNLGKVAITIDKSYWDINKDYDKLVIVEKQGEFKTYISRKPVPAGTSINDREYWIPFSSLNEKILIDYNKHLNELNIEIKDYINQIDTNKNNVNKLITLINNNPYINFIKTKNTNEGIEIIGERYDSDKNKSEVKILIPLISEEETKGLIYKEDWKKFKEDNEYYNKRDTVGGPVTLINERGFTEIPLRFLTRATNSGHSGYVSADDASAIYREGIASDFIFGYNNKNDLRFEYTHIRPFDSTNTNPSGTHQSIEIPNFTISKGGIVGKNQAEKLTLIIAAYNNKNTANNLLVLDNSGKVPSNNLPSYVDDVLEYDSVSAFPSTGEFGKIYVDTSNNRTYRWSGTQYIKIHDIELGTAQGHAYPGDRGLEFEYKFDKLKEDYDALNSLIIQFHGSFTVNANKTIIEKGVSNTITFTTIATFNGNSLNHTLEINGAATKTSYTITDTTTFNCVLKVNNKNPKLITDINKTIIVNAYYPKYIGGSSKANIVSSDITTFDKKAITSSASGSYNVTSNDNEYVWFCVPSNMTINKVTLNGFAVPMQTAIDITITEDKIYKCYRTANPLSAGTRTFVVS